MPDFTDPAHQFPYRHGDTTVLGPEIFSSTPEPCPEAVISWKGENFTPQPLALQGSEPRYVPEGTQVVDRARGETICVCAGVMSAKLIAQALSADFDRWPRRHRGVRGERELVGPLIDVPQGVRPAIPAHGEPPPVCTGGGSTTPGAGHCGDMTCPVHNKTVEYDGYQVRPGAPCTVTTVFRPVTIDGLCEGYAERYQVTYLDTAEGVGPLHASHGRAMTWLHAAPARESR